MTTFIKLIATSIIFAAVSTTAHAGQSPSTYSQADASVQLAVQTSKVRTIVRKVKPIPTAHSAKTQESRTVLFFDTQPTRTKVIKAKPSQTSTPNLFR